MDVFCHIRVFDLNKYREIEPILNTIENNKNLDKNRIISLIKQAIDKISSKEFQKFNGTTGLGRSYLDHLKNGLALVESGGLSEWLNSQRTKDSELASEEEYIMPYFSEQITYENSLIEQDLKSAAWKEPVNLKSEVDFDEVVDIIILLLCCPRYQEYTGSPLPILSDTTIEYTDVYGALYLFNQKIRDLLDYGTQKYPRDCVLLNHRKGGILHRDLLSDFTKLVSQDLAKLSQPGHILYLVRSNEGFVREYQILPEPSVGKNLIEGDFLVPDREIYDNLVHFYISVNNALKVVNSNPNYTIINERL